MNIISLSPSTTEILFAIDAGNMIVANTYFCDYPEKAKKLPKVGSFSHVDMEKFTKFNPDIIFTSTVVQERIYKELLEKGFKTVHFDPRSISEIMDSIISIGKLVNKEKEAYDVIKEMENDIKKLRSNSLKKKPRIYIEEWYDPPMYSGNWVPEIVQLAGGEYGFATQGDISRETQLDKLLVFNPEYIFVSYCGFGKKSDPQQVLKRKDWENITAIKKNQVFPIDETILNRPGPRIIDAAKELQSFFVKS